MKKTRKKRTIVKWQTKDQGADPLTARGKKWIKKEIAACDEAALRKQLEGQEFNNSDAPSYWHWMDMRGYNYEPNSANPDLSDDDIHNTVD